MSNEDAMKQYDVKKYRTPDGYTTDIAVFTILPVENEDFKQPVMDMKIMLIQRSLIDSEGRTNIEAGKWALPGGFVDPNETAMECAKRELMEETGIENIYLEHFGVYDKSGRDPRGWMISNAHFAIVPEHKLSHRQAQDDADDVQLFSIKEVFNLNLAFDHAHIIDDAIEVISKKMFETTGYKDFLFAGLTYSDFQMIFPAVTDSSIKD